MDTEQQFTTRPGYAGHTRKLSDKVLTAFRQACAQCDYAVAEQLLHVLEMMLVRGPTTQEECRQDMEAVVAAHEWLWALRHPETMPSQAWSSWRRRFLPAAAQRPRR
jgi:hypothetical protein